MSRIPRHALVRAVVKVRAMEFDVPGIEVEDYYLHGKQEEKPPSPKAKANDARRTAQCCQRRPLGGPIRGERHCCRLCELVWRRPALRFHRTAHAWGDDRPGKGDPDQGNDRGADRGEETSPGITRTGRTRTAPCRFG